LLWHLEKANLTNNFLYLMFFDEQEIKIITLSKPEELIRKREASGRWLRINQR
jgi:hypothetical protein